MSLYCHIENSFCAKKITIVVKKAPNAAYFITIDVLGILFACFCSILSVFLVCTFLPLNFHPLGYSLGASQ